MKVNVYASFRQKSKFLVEREQQLNDTEELLRAGRKLSEMLESLPVGVLIADVQGRICQTNDQVARICNGAQGFEHDFYGEAFGWWNSAEKSLKQNGPLFRAIHHGETTHNQPIKIKCNDSNKAKTIVGSASPLLGLDGHIVGAVVIIQDLTETKSIEAEMENRITRLVATGVELEESISR
jgi:PAS domain-containing protein